MRDIQTKVQILIPVYNQVNDIDKTIESIWNQTFDKKNIFVVAVDFGSTDGSYDKLLNYSPYHFGVYECTADISQTTMVAETCRLGDFTFPEGEYTYQMILYPGDIIYPEYLETMADAMYRYYSYNPALLISEVEIETKTGETVRASKLYEDEHIINGKNEYMEYFTRGNLHNIMCFGGKIRVRHHRCYGMQNERVWWSKGYLAGFRRNVIYIPKRLACIKERFYEDELQEILLRWEGLILFRRNCATNFKFQIEYAQLLVMEENLSKYALWRSFLMMKQGNLLQAKECFQISGVIFYQIKECEVYRWLEEWIMGGNPAQIDKVEAYFNDSRSI